MYFLILTIFLTFFSLVYIIVKTENMLIKSILFVRLQQWTIKDSGVSKVIHEVLAMCGVSASNSHTI